MVENCLPGLLLTAVLVAGVSLVPLSFSDYPPPLQQIEYCGVHPEDVQCNDGLVHAIRANGDHVCVRETTSERLGWEVFVVEEVAPPGKEDAAGAASEGAGSYEVVLNASSSVGFVDDGREILGAKLEPSGPPNPMYDAIMNSEISPDSIGHDKLARIQSTPHEKYSVNPGVGFYVEDWMPTHIIDGQRLLYADTGCYRSGDCYLKMQFVPTTFVLDENVTNHSLDFSKGYLVHAEYEVKRFYEIDYIVTSLSKIFESEPGAYGGFVNTTRDGKTVWAYEGGRHLYRHYQAILNFDLDEHIWFGVKSKYHTLDEIMPVFVCMGN